jgi:3-methyladenine DNA glycosylase Tag
VQGADKEARADDTEQVRRHTEADIESGGAMKEKGFWHEGDTSNDTFLKAVSGYR